MASEGTKQHLDILIQDDMKYDIRIENAQINDGEFYTEDNENDVLTCDDVNDMGIRHNGGQRHICSVSDTNSVSGPYGAVDLVDDVRDTRICTLAWHATMKPGERNTLALRNQDPRYQVDIGNWTDHGVMGEVPVTVNERGPGELR